MSMPIWMLRGSTYSCSGSCALNGRSGDPDDLERPDDPAAVVGQDPGGGVGIDLREARVQSGRADLGQLGLELAAYGGIGAGELEPVEHRPRVEGRAADQDRASDDDRGSRRPPRAPSPGTPRPSAAR